MVARDAEIDKLPLRIVGLVCSSIAVLFGGVIYAFAIVQSTLTLEPHNFTNAESGTVGIFMGLASDTSGIFHGGFYDRFGTTPHLILIFLSGLMGYVGACLGFAGHSTLWSTPTMFSLSFILIGFAGSGAVLTLQTVNTLNFPESMQQSVIGIIQACFGLSAFVFSSIYAGYSHNLVSAFNLWSAILLSAWAVCVCLVRHIPLPKNELPLALNAAGTVAYGSVTGRNRKSTAGVELSGSSVYQPIEGESGETDIAPTDAEQAEVGFREHVWLLFHNPRWLLFYGIALVGFGGGLVFINNLSSIERSLYPDNPNPAQTTGYLVSTYAVSGAISRILVSWISDKTPNIRRGVWITVSLVISSLCHITGAIFLNVGFWLEIDILYLIVAGSGIGFGIFFTICMGVTLEVFGGDRFATNVGLLLTASGIGGAIYNSVAGAFYAWAVQRQGSSDGSCTGFLCFVNTLLVSGGLFFIASWCSLPFATKWTEKRSTE